MGFSIQFENDTVESFNDRLKYYRNISEEIAVKFHKEFWFKIDYIKEYPLHHSIRYRNIRIANLSVFPIGIHFIIDGNVILVLKILHHKQFYK